MNIPLHDFCKLRTAAGCVIVSLRGLECPCSVSPAPTKLENLHVLILKTDKSKQDPCLKKKTFTEMGQQIDRGPMARTNLVLRKQLGVCSCSRWRQRMAVPCFFQRQHDCEFLYVCGKCSKQAVSILSNMKASW